MRSRRRPSPWRWQNVGGMLVLLRLDEYSAPASTEPARRVSGFLIGICVLVGGLGLGMMVLSGMDLLAGDFSSTGSGRGGWITPPIAFVIGLGLAVSPYFIIRQERNAGSRHSTESWGSVLALYPEGVALHEGPFEGHYGWDGVSTAVLDVAPEPARAVVGHYLRHPEDRHEIGTEAAGLRAQSLSRSP